jgi:hypothetical protein
MLMAVPLFSMISFALPMCCQQQRTRREDRHHFKFYEVRDNLRRLCGILCGVPLCLKAEDSATPQVYGGSFADSPCGVPVLTGHGCLRAC